MTDASPTVLTLDQLQSRLQAADPRVLLVAPRVLRRIIRLDHRLPALRWNVPHRKGYTIDREVLLDLVEPHDLGLEEGRTLPAQVILLERPRQDELDFGDLDELLRGCWRLLFHARVHLAMAERIAANRLTPADVQQRMGLLGQAAFEEIGNVLQQESFLFDEHDDRDVYVEFAAVYLELSYFARGLLPSYFPALENPEDVARILAHDLDAESLFDGLERDLRRAFGEQFPGELPQQPANTLDLLPLAAEESENLPAVREPSPPRFRRLMLKSQRAAQKGNAVGAAILAARAERCAPPKLAGKARAAARRAIVRLLHRLELALPLPACDLGAEEALWALLRQTPRRLWTVEARLLYDLQKVCVDAEREVFTVDLVEWALSRGRRPIRRGLPSQRDVLMAKHLAGAEQRLTAVRISDEARQQLAALVNSALGCAQQRIRDDFRPRIAAVLDDVGLVPQNLPERVARRKLIEELLDRVSRRSLLTMGDLRDALSRNNLKLPDLARPSDLWQSDALLRANERLAVVLDGVYHRGEFYLRWMQRVSAPGFGTAIGRAITQYFVVPFGGALLTLLFAVHVLEKILHREPEISRAQYALATFAGGLFLLGLIHNVPFRQGVWWVTKNTFQALRAILFDAPRWLFLHSPLRLILQSRLAAAAVRLFLEPAIVTAVIWALAAPSGWSWGQAALALVAIFAAATVLLNSRLARNLEELAFTAVGYTWHRVGLPLVSGLFYLIVDVFKRLLEGAERLLYSVDQWLRFRSGESRAMLVVKALLGVLWFYVAYVTRFCLNLLIEPQVNPIKHFPVVTVSHKILFTVAFPYLVAALSYTMKEGLAIALGTGIIACIPGIFGFLVWELRENWRLYAANRPPRLVPVAIGRHGETLLRLLRPGFHSGTLPKRYAKLCRADRRARLTQNAHAVRRHLHALEEVETELIHFLQRDFLALFEESSAWKALPPTVEQLRAGTNRVRAVVVCPTIADAAMTLRFEFLAVGLTADLPEPGWSRQLSPEQRQVFSTALFGLYQLGAVALVDGRPPAPLSWPEWLQAWEEPRRNSEGGIRK